MGRVLLVEDDPQSAAAARKLLNGKGYEIGSVSTVADETDPLRTGNYDVVRVDLALPDGSGLDRVRADGPKAAARAARGPAFDHLTKPVDSKQPTEVVRAAVGNGAGPAKTKTRRDIPYIVGCSESMVALRELIHDYGPTDIPVLIEGESGTGKELVARALHDVHRPNTRFLPINCGAIPKELIASELFGHEKGSFTGASSRHEGVFERAGDGTVLLDEISEPPAEHQVALLRVLESHSIQRVGGNREIPIKARVIAATNQDLTDRVREGEFREDLFYRLAVLLIKVPPLRERRDDIPMLSHHFLEKFAVDYATPSNISTEVLRELQTYAWPGNVRELKHTLLRAALLCRGRDSIDNLPGTIRSPSMRTDFAAALQAGTSIREAEEILIRRTLRHYGGKRKPAAEALGISLKTLYNRLKEYDTDNPARC